MNIKEYKVKQIHRQKDFANHVHTIIIKRQHLENKRSHLSILQMPAISRSSQPSSRSCNIRTKKYRSISENSGNSITLPVHNLEQNQMVKPGKIKSSKIIPHNDSKLKSNLLNPYVYIFNQSQKGDFKGYLQYIRASSEQQYLAQVNFQKIRRRGRREGVKQKQYKIFEQISSIFTCIEYNLIVANKDSTTLIKNYCQIYFAQFEKIKIQILFLLHFPDLLQARLRPFFVYQRLLMYILLIYSNDNKFLEISQAQRNSIKIITKYIKQCYTMLFKTITYIKPQAPNRINQTFQMLKVVNEIVKKLLVIKRQLCRIPIRYKKSFAEIQSILQSLAVAQQQWSFEQLAQIQMEISWKYLSIPPVPYLPPNYSGKQYTIVLDLDETIIHYDIEGKTLKYRPYLDLFLSKIASFYEIVVFSKSNHKYTHLIASQVEKNKKYFYYRLSESHLTLNKGQSIKEVSKLGRNLRHLIIIDHSPIYYKNFQLNGIQISPWYGDKTDKALFKLINILSYCCQTHLRYQIVSKVEKILLQQIEEQKCYNQQEH